MKRWGCQIVMAGVIGIPLSLTAAEPSRVDDRGISPQPEPVAHTVGMGGCALRGCHNSPAQGKGSEYRLWSTVNPHSRAFDVLSESRSQRMAQAIGLSEPAQKSEFCLKCHSADAPSIPPSDHLRESAGVRLSDGVSCEACHGAASQWLAPHLRREWRSHSKSFKSQFGLRDLSSPRGRVEACLDCHVGAPGFEVTHDMIAAGHPRLLFEATAFYDGGVRHWDETQVRRRDPQFTAKLWLIGQTSTLKRTIANLEARSSDRLFTEFADHDCYACHKSLVGRSFAKPLTMSASTWGRWPAELTQLAENRNLGLPPGTIEEVAQLRDRFQLTQVDRSALQLHALSNKLAAWDSFADRAEWSPSALRAIILDCASPIDAGDSDWEVAWQRYRALTALSQSWNSGQAALSASPAGPLAELKASLRMPKGFSSPKGFDLEAFNRQLEILRKIFAANP